MEKKFRNGEQKWDTCTKVEATQEMMTVDRGQLQDVIGNFGRYQFLIFMFKILIGVTSAFNNLGVTFFAPTDFVGYWCTNASALNHYSHNSSIAGNNISSSFHLPNMQQEPISFTFREDGSNFFNQNQNLSIVQHARSPNPNLGYQSILNEFMFSSERSRRHQLDFNYDTPKNVRKECGYTLTSADKKQHNCKSYQYDTGIWMSTIIDEWDLVCDRAWLVSITQSLYMSGFIVSFLVFGYVSDHFGRWRSLMAGALIEVTCGFGCAFAPSIRWFIIFRFLLGLGNAGRSSSSYLIMIEWAGPKWRMHISTIGSLGWVIGYCSMPWITLYFLHFRHMQLFVCFYELIFVMLLLCLPESPRWLLTHRRFDEAYEVLLMAAKFNGLIKKDKMSEPDSRVHHQLDDIISAKNEKQQAASAHPTAVKISAFHEPSTKQAKKLLATDTDDINNSSQDNQLKPFTIEEFNLKFKMLVDSTLAKEFTKNEDNLSIVDLFRWKNLRKYALVLFFVWAADSFIYYGIALRVGDFGGKNLFVAFTIAGITELPSIAFTILCMKFLPRKTGNLFIFATTGLLCALQVPLKYYDYRWLQQWTMMLAKLFNTCSFTCVLYQTMELFPTSIRQTAYSSCSLAGRIGSILAPFIKELAQLTNDSVPPIIYAILSLLTAILIKILPETKGSDLPDTLLEAENFKGISVGQKGASLVSSMESLETCEQPIGVTKNIRHRSTTLDMD